MVFAESRQAGHVNSGMLCMLAKVGLGIMRFVTMSLRSRSSAWFSANFHAMAVEFFVFLGYFHVHRHCLSQFLCRCFRFFKSDMLDSLVLFMDVAD